MLMMVYNGLQARIINHRAVLYVKRESQEKLPHGNEKF